MQREFFVRKASGLVRQLSAKDALMYNVLDAGHVWPFMYIVIAAVTFPGVDMPSTVILSGFFIFLMSFTYYFFAITMPRSGGDFVWVSRSIHPAIAFMESFMFVAVVISFVGPIGGWLLDPAIRSMLINWGTVTNTPQLIAQANALPTITNLFISSLIVTLIACGANVFSAKTLWKFLWVLFVIGLIGVVGLWLMLLSTGHSGFVANFNRITGANYDDIIKAAQSGGYNTGVTTQGIVLGSVWSFSNFIGFWFASYTGGEIKNPTRSQTIATFGEIIVLGFITWMTYETANLVAGSEFIKAGAYLAATGNSAWTLSMPPNLAMLAVFTTNNPWLAILPPIALMVAVIGGMTANITMATRVLFAWSFDRIIPTRISRVDERFHAPRNALLLVLGIGIVYVFLTWFTPVMSYLLYGNLAMWFPQVIVGIAGMIFPYRRKDIFEKAPKIVQTKIGSVPLMSIFGLITAAGAAFLSFASVAPTFLGAPVQPLYVLAVALTGVAAFIIYGIAYLYNRRIGIDMHMGFREIPPA